MLETTLSTLENSGDHQASVRPKLMDVGRILLFADAIAAATGGHDYAADPAFGRHRGINQEFAALIVHAARDHHRPGNAAGIGGSRLYPGQRIDSAID